ncbi:hypothetical protein EGT74_26645 [Chitinophaga lutea]|uniref:Tissue inhibitor of metalloproteinase n=1 Tax=Chitinophaga lutea TaxID=2488634 RepID=A0A3N4PCI2_9BACT|nr:hypothetical protein [Chitinophaga lutea]RPE05936.1 hypothetical protein EGT74_26645 [Chitinophaga lutea]
MKYLLLLTAALLSLQPVMACKCREMPRLDSLAQLKDYQFIARVRIIDDGDHKTLNGNGQPGVLRFKVVRLFKGRQRTQILEMAKGSSCDMYIGKGEEWIIFGKLQNGKLSIGPCDRNILYRPATGGVEAISQSASEVLKKLQELYRKKTA